MRQETFSDKVIVHGLTILTLAGVTAIVYGVAYFLIATLLEK